jgi:hypothetical protein
LNSSFLSQRYDGLGRGVLGMAGFYVGASWLLSGLIEVIDWKGGSLIDLGVTHVLPLLGGMLLIGWTALGVTKPTPLRFIPPTLVAIPFVLFGLSQIVMAQL